MSLDPLVTTPATTSPTRTVVVRRKRGPRVWIALTAALILIGAVGAQAWSNGFQIQDLWRERPVPLALVEIDEGRLEVSVTETGNLESAVSSKVKCQVEALLGTVTASSASSGTSGTTGSRTSTTGGSSQTSQAAATTTPTKAKTASKTSGTTAKAGAGTTAKAGASGTAAADSSSSASTSAAGSGASTVGKKPTIRSFSYVVAKHVPLRGTTTKAAATTTTAASSASASGGGGGRGGGRGGRGGANATPEVQGSTRIIEILPEGTAVKAGEIVCSLDSAANFRDEYQAQQIKHAQAKAWVEQAKAILRVNEITYQEYRYGIYPQDLMLIKRYIETCEVEFERAVKTEAWSKETLTKGFRASAQYSADQIELQRAGMALKEARSMEARLLKYRAPMLLKSLEAKLQSIRSDLLAQEASFGIEDDRLRRLKKMIDNCTIRAPREGIIVYANESNQWSGRTEVEIQEGATVREGQPLFDLPDPNLMRVKVKINESKMASIHPGQRALIQIEAFPDKPLNGVVTEITPIPAVLGRYSDIRIYFAYVKLDTGGFTGLRPGMSAEVSFFVEAHPKVTRVPVESVRWIGEKAFAAVADTGGDGVTWAWRPIELGLMNDRYAEVVSGLKVGERIVASPMTLPAPTVSKSPPAIQTAGTGADSTRG